MGKEWWDIIKLRRSRGYAYFPSNPYLIIPNERVWVIFSAPSNASEKMMVNFYVTDPSMKSILFILGVVTTVEIGPISCRILPPFCPQDRTAFSCYSTNFPMELLPTVFMLLT